MEKVTSIEMVSSTEDRKEFVRKTKKKDVRFDGWYKPRKMFKN